MIFNLNEIKLIFYDFEFLLKKNRYNLDVFLFFE